jgi:nucleoside-diphosphate-sugar epimerase
VYDGNERVEWLNEHQATEVAQHCRYLLSAGPLDLARQFLLAGETFERVVVFSSSSVETKQASGHPAERKQIQDMLSLESELGYVAEGKNLKLVIFRPTLIYGCGLDTNISRLANWIKRFGFMPVNGAATGLRQPVHADDLAAAALTALLCREDLPRVLNLCGGDTLTYADMVSRIFSAMDKPVRLLHLPQWLFVLVVNIIKVIRPGAGLHGEMVRRQCLDLVFDDRQARSLLGYKPRSFQPVAADFLPPPIG